MKHPSTPTSAPTIKRKSLSECESEREREKGRVGGSRFVCVLKLRINGIESWQSTIAHIRSKAAATTTAVLAAAQRYFIFVLHIFLSFWIVWMVGAIGMLPLIRARTHTRNTHNSNSNNDNNKHRVSMSCCTYHIHAHSFNPIFSEEPFCTLLWVIHISVCFILAHLNVYHIVLYYTLLCSTPHAHTNRHSHTHTPHVACIGTHTHESVLLPSEYHG